MLRQFSLADPQKGPESLFNRAAETSNVRRVVRDRLRQLEKAESFDAWLARSGKLMAFHDLISGLRLEIAVF